jgi:hypothetical protein
MITSLFPRASTYNAELGVREGQGRLDAEAVVNQYGTVNHTKSFWNNIGSGLLDAVGAIPGVGNVVNGVRAIGNVVTGDFAAGAESALKAVPFWGNWYSGISAVKNGSDALVHAGGMIEQSAKGGYEYQTRVGNMMAGNMSLGMAGLYGNYYPAFRAGGGTFGGAGATGIF